MSSSHFLMGMLILLSGSVLEVMVDEKCDRHQFYNKATHECMDCADLYVCGDPSLINKCPPECVDDMYLGASETISTQETRIANLSNTIKAQKVQIANMASTIKAKNQHVANMGSTIKALKVQVANMSNTIEAKNQHVTNMASTIKAKNQHITNMTSTIKALKVQVANMSNTIKAQNQHVTNMASTIKAKNQHVANMSSTIKTLEENIANLSTSNMLWMTMAICFIILFMCLVSYLVWKNRLSIIKFIRKVCKCVGKPAEPPPGDLEQPPPDMHVDDTGTETDPLVGCGHDDDPPTAHVPQGPAQAVPHVPPGTQTPHAVPQFGEIPRVRTVTEEEGTETAEETPSEERSRVLAIERATTLPVPATPDGGAEGKTTEEADRHNKDKTGDVLPSILAQGPVMPVGPPGSPCAPSLEEPETKIKQPASGWTTAETKF